MPCSSAFSRRKPYTNPTRTLHDQQRQARPGCLPGCLSGHHRVDFHHDQPPPSSTESHPSRACTTRGGCSSPAPRSVGPVRGGAPRGSHRRSHPDGSGAHQRPTPLHRLPGALPGSLTTHWGARGATWMTTQIPLPGTSRTAPSTLPTPRGARYTGCSRRAAGQPWQP